MIGVCKGLFSRRLEMFEDDLKKWRETEVEFATKLLQMWASMIELAPDRQFYDWDIRAKQWELLNDYEIKDDKISKTTGNVWFEYKCNWRPSGIYMSKADFIVYKVDGKFYCVQRAMLLIRLEFVNKTRVKWWDGDLSELFIVKKKDFFSFVDRSWWVV